MSDNRTDTGSAPVWRDALHRFAEGDPKARIEGSSNDQDVEQLRLIVNEALERAATRYGVLHDSVMEIAVGLADVYETLHAYRHGDRTRRVGAATVASSEGLVGQLGGMINDLLDEMGTAAG